MPQKILFSALISLVSYTSCLGQSRIGENAYKSSKLSISIDSYFVKTLAYMQNHNYFIEAVDKAVALSERKTSLKTIKYWPHKQGRKEL